MQGGDIYRDTWWPEFDPQLCSSKPFFDLWKHFSHAARTVCHCRKVR